MSYSLYDAAVASCIQIVGAHSPRAELILLRMDSRERADIEYDFLLRPLGILMAHDAWVLRPLGEAVLIDIAVKGRRDACILLRLTRPQFCRSTSGLMGSSRALA